MKTFVRALVAALFVAAPPLVAQPVPVPVPPPVPGVPAAPIVPATPVPPSVPALRVGISSGLRGDLTSLDCGAENAPSRFEELSARLAGAGDAVLFDSGDLLGASAVAHLATDGDVGALADAIAATHLRAIALGHRDLGAPRADVIARARALGQRNVPVVLTNLRCEASAQSLCDAVVDASDPPMITTTDRGAVAFIAVAAPRVLSFVARDRSESITLTDPAESIARATLAARNAGARYVVAQFDPAGPDPLAEALALARTTSADARPDVLFANELSQQLARAVVQRDGLNVVSSVPGEVMVTDGTAAVAAQPAAPAAVVPEVHAFVTGLHQRLCSTLATPLAGARITAPIDREAFTTLLLDVIREQTSSEVSIVNRAAVRPISRFPLTGAITRLDVTAAMPFDDSLRVGRVRGEVLAAFARGERASHFTVRGITRDGDALQINGRPLDPDQLYRVVTTGYVADGGDGGLWGEDEDPWDLVRVPGDGPRDTLLRWLSIEREGDITQAPIDPAQRTRWTFRFVVDGAYSNTSIVNPQGYQDTQLARSESTNIDLDAELRANAEQPRYTLDNSLRVLLGFSRTVDEAGGDTGILPSSDLISLRSAFAWRGIYSSRRFWHPLPYVENYVESEFSAPTGPMVTRDFHHLQYRPTAGVRFELPKRATVSLSGGIDWETLQPGGAPRAVLVARGELPPTHLFSIQDREVEGQLNTELSWRDPGMQTSDAIIRLTTKISVPIIEPLSITVAFDLFARRRQSDPWAFSNDLNLGLQVDLLRTLQLFRY